ncbi:MAG: hypothetical protein FWC96_08410 [Oscillospiraceae bacterium]|nr:hypothetical protein [Oscillospiraceae bacterium]
MGDKLNAIDEYNPAPAKKESTLEKIRQGKKEIAQQQPKSKNQKKSGPEL